MQQTLICSVHKDGWLFIAIFATVSLLIGLIAEPLGYIGAILTAWCVYFFRDPERVTPIREGLIVSPADGIVTGIIETVAPAELDLGIMPFTRVSIFLNVFNVHVNRIPIGGKITKTVYYPGKFFNASLDKASEHNERQASIVETTLNQKIVFVQIAGLIARRIRCDLRENQEVLTGSRFGMIRFGSRVDVYLPLGVSPMVSLGQIMIGGETVLADFNTVEPARIGEIRL